MAGGGTVNVLLKKVLVSVAPERVRLASFTERCRMIGVLQDDRTLALWDIDERWQAELTDVQTFAWCTFSQACDPEEVSSTGDSFVTVKTDHSIELRYIAAKETSTECQAVLTAEILESLLRDRGKDVSVGGVGVISVTKHSPNHNAPHSLILLINQSLVVVLSVSKLDPPQVTTCFAIDFPTEALPMLVPFSAIARVKRSWDLIFSLFSSGMILIHHVQGNLVGWVDMWSLYCSSQHSSESIDQDEVHQYGITFTQLGVTEDLLLVICADTSNNLYIINMDQYFERHPQHLNHGPSGRPSTRRRKVWFEYDAADEDAVARNPGASTLLYGDRVWKTELVGLRTDAYQGAFMKSGTPQNLVPSVQPSEKHTHWYKGFIDIDVMRQKDVATGRHHVFQAERSRNLNYSTQTTESVASSLGVESLVKPSGLVIARAQSWMKTHDLQALVTSSDSVLLSFGSKTEESGSEFCYGALCLFDFSTEEFTVHGMKEPTVVVASGGSPHYSYLLTQKMLSIAAFDMTQDQLVHKVILYENAALAESLCHLNKWDHCTIPIHALEVALQLRQLDTVAFFLRNQQNAFTRSTSSSSESGSTGLLSSSPLSPVSVPLESATDTKDIRGVIDSLVKAVKYNLRQQHNMHFSQQLIQMTLTHLHGLMEDGATFLEHASNTSHVTVEPQEHVPATCQQLTAPDVEECMRYVSTSIVELRKHLRGASTETGDKVMPTDATRMEAFVGTETDVADWSVKLDATPVKEFIEDAILSGNLCAAQAVLLSDRSAERVVTLDTCDGSLSSVKEIGLRGVLARLVQHETDAAIRMLTNLGRDVTAQLRRICFHTLHRHLRDFLCEELEARGHLTDEDRETIQFLHAAEDLYDQRSFERAKAELDANTERWTDLGLLGNSFNLCSTQVLETYFRTSSLLSTQSQEQAAGDYAELLLDWASLWDASTRQRILAERLLATKAQTSRAQVGAEALWRHLCSHGDWRTLQDWVRAASAHVTWHSGEGIALGDGNPSFPPLSRDVYSQLNTCARFVRELVLDELTRHGMFTDAQLSDFPLLLRHLSKTRMLFGASHPLSSLDRCAQDAQGAMDDRAIISVTDFHHRFIEYCIQKELVGLLYYYIDFYRLCETEEDLDALQVHLSFPPWLECLVRFRIAGIYFSDPIRVFRASLANSRLVMQTSAPSVAEMLQQGRTVMAMATLLYGPGPVSQAIVPTSGVVENPGWQVEECVLQKNLAVHPKLYSALFPGTSVVGGMEIQDISVYRLLQGNCPFEISRMFGWQQTNELASKNVAAQEMPHFSLGQLVSEHAHSEQLTFSYFLRHGRPAFAFTTFVAEQLREKSIFKTRIQQAALKAYRVAVQNFTESQISSACVVFTEMLGVDSTPLRVDLQVANRILTHGGREGRLGSDLQDGETMQDTIAFELLSCAGRVSRQPDRLLVALEEATTNQISKQCLDRTSFEAGEQWNLVLLFCRAHKLELVTTYLQDCARAEKWLTLLCHAQSCQYPPHQVVEVINHFMNPSHLKEHILLALQNVQVLKVEQGPEEKEASRRRRKKKASRQEQPTTPPRDVRAQFYARMGLVPASSTEAPQQPPPQSSSAEDDEAAARARSKRDSDRSSSSASEAKPRANSTGKTEGADLQHKPLDADALPQNLFDVLFRCQAASVPWRSLLAHAIALHRALLTVLAACYEDAKPLDCICAWLCSTLPNDELVPAVAEISGASTGNQYTADISDLHWHRWRMEDLSLLLQVVIRAKDKFAHALTKAFYIFDPESPMVHFLRFHESFVVQKDYEACMEQLSLFKRAYSKMSLKGSQGKGMGSGKIDELDWLERATNKITRQMLAQCDTSYEQNHLLALLAKTMFGRNFNGTVPNYYKLHEVSELVRDAGVNMRLSLLMDEESDEANTEKDRVMTLLLHLRRFRKARKFAAVLGLPDDHITLKEVLSERDSIQNSKLWDVEQGRLAFWHKTDKCFAENHVGPSVAADFFQRESESEALPYMERASLLSLALKWYRASREAPADNTADLIQLQRKMWLLRIRAQMEDEREARYPRSISHLDFLPNDVNIDFPVQDNATGNPRSFQVHLADELVQEKSLGIDDSSVSPLETPEEKLALEKVSGELLEGGRVTQARWLSALFDHRSPDVDIVMSCIDLAQGRRHPDSLDEPVRRMLASHKQRRLSRTSSVSSQGRSDSFILSSSFTDVALGDGQASTGTDWAQVEDTLTTMESLSYHCKQGKQCCACVVTCYKISHTLGLEYSSVVKKKPFELLHLLLTSGFDNRYKLTETYIKAFHLDTAPVTKFLADTVLHSLQLYSTGQELPSHSEYVDLVVNAAPSRDDVSQVIKLCPDQSSLGNRLLEEASSSATERLLKNPTSSTFSFEVELLVRAHECHTLACNMEGIARVLRRGKFLTTSLAEAAEYRLMVRLLTGVGRFRDMSYIFDTLLEHDHFELLCRRGIDKENKLKVALLDYLKRYQPTDTEKYSIVAHHFSMHREIAETLEETATLQLKSLKGNMAGPNPDLQAKLKAIMRSFCYAADGYSKEGCLRHSQTCLKQARLVQLQIQLLPAGVKVVNLEERELSKFLATHSHFFEALLVAEAYKKRGSNAWVNAVYAQVVIGGDFKYLQDLRSAVSLSSVFYVDVVTKYRQENPRSSQATANIRKLLGYLAEVRIRYKLATDMNFQDMASSILETNAYLKDILVP